MAEELMPIFDNTGVLYFTRIGHKANKGGSGSGSDIWMLPSPLSSNYQPDNNNEWNNRENNALIGMNANGSTVYLLNGYGRKNGIAFSRKLDGRWTKPEIVPIPGLSEYGFKGFFMSPDFKYLLISMNSSDSYGEEDLYVSVRQSNGKWASPINLGASINTVGFEISPFLSADGKTLFFASNGHGGFGESDIFRTQRLYDSWDVWSQPENLGGGINSPAFDAYFSFYDSVAFFSSNRDGGLSDIFKAVLVAKRSGVNTIANQILSDSEIVANFGFIFDPLIEFESNGLTLSAKDRELLWFIADKLNKRSDVHIALYQPKLRNDKKRQLIVDYLGALNFPTEKITIDLGDWKPDGKVIGDDKVQLIFFKPN